MRIAQARAAKPDDRALERFLLRRWQRHVADVPEHVAYAFELFVGLRDSSPTPGRILRTELYAELDELGVDGGWRAYLRKMVLWFDQQHREVDHQSLQARRGAAKMTDEARKAQSRNGRGQLTPRRHAGKANRNPRR